MARSARSSSTKKSSSGRKTTSRRSSSSSPSMGMMNSVRHSSGSSRRASTGKPSPSTIASKHKLTSDYRPGIGVSHRMRER